MDKIVFCGSILTDVIKMIPTWPEMGMLVPIGSISRAVGGSVCNSGVDLKMLDSTLEVKALGKVGEDENGDFVIKVLEARGIDCSLVARSKYRPTSFTDVMTIASTGARTFFNYHGADSTLRPEDVDVNSLGCDIFHFGYLLLLDGMDAEDEEYGTKAARLLAKVQAAGIKTSIDIVSEQSERFARVVRPALKYCDYAIVNEIEGSMATGVDRRDLKGICSAMFDLGVKERVVIHTPEIGVSLAEDGAWAEVASLKLPEGWIKGSVGAGDAFCAGVLYSIMKGMSAEEGLLLGAGAAACNLSVADSISGARNYFETMDIVNRFK